MKPDSPTRRALLRAAGAGGVALVAGCTGTGSDPTTGRPSTTTTTRPTTDGTTEMPTTTQDASTTTAAGMAVAEMEAAARAFVSDLASGDYEAALAAFAESVRGQVTTGKLEGTWNSLVEALGRFVEVTATTHTTVRGMDVIRVTAQFANGRRYLNVVFDGTGAVAGFRVSGSPDTASWSPPPYVDRQSFSETAVTLEATDACSLPGTITMPTGDANVPGVVLVHGSGPSDRDETLGPNRPFKDLAWGLASRGVAVLRYEKRTAACEVDPATLTIDAEVTGDALAALGRLGATDRVRPADACVVGHSLGAMLAPRIAARAETVAGAAMLAAPARSQLDIAAQQREYLASLDGTVTDAERERIQSLREAVERVRSDGLADGELVLGGSARYWESLAAYDQVETAHSLSVPLFVAQGGRDYQVTVEDDFRRWRAELARENVTFERYPDLNHLFMPGEGQPRPGEYYEPSHVAEPVVSDLANWVHDVTGA